MKKFGKFILWFFGIIIVLGIIGSLFSDDEQTAQDDTSTAATSNVKSDANTNEQNEDKKEESEQVEKTFAIGDKVEAGKLAYIVSNVETTNELKSDNEFIESATTDGQFVVIDIEAFNNDQETRMVDSSMFKIKDEQGREFEPSSDTDVMMVVEESMDFFLQDINPGLSKTGKLVFELPKDASSYTLEVSSGFGWAGGESASIKLK